LSRSGRLRGVLAALLLLAPACARETKHSLLEKAEHVETKTQLEAALGAPDDRHKLGPIETWTYDASDGRVTFLITGENVTLQATSEPAP
jgi:hypothetical protein